MSRTAHARRMDFARPRLTCPIHNREVQTQLGSPGSYQCIAEQAALRQLSDTTSYLLRLTQVKPIQGLADRIRATQSPEPHGQLHAEEPSAHLIHRVQQHVPRVFQCTDSEASTLQYRGIVLGCSGTSYAGYPRQARLSGPVYLQGEARAPSLS